jgi:hypothetical protein
MVTNDALGPLRKLFAKLLCQLGRIAEIGIIYVRVLRDDRLDSAAHPVRGLALGQPDGLKQFVDVARPARFSGIRP